MATSAYPGSSCYTSPGRERDVSPSAQSQSSAIGLEWDPSADVGSHVPTNTPVHHPKTGDKTILDQIVLALNQEYELVSSVAASRRAMRGDSSSNNSGGSSSSYRTATETAHSSLEPSASSMRQTSTSSNWQTSGVTRSERQYRSKTEDTTSSHDSTSFLWVEVNADSTSNKGSRSEDRSAVVKSTRDEEKRVASEGNGDQGRHRRVHENKKECVQKPQKTESAQVTDPARKHRAKQQCHLSMPSSVSRIASSRRKVPATTGCLNHAPLVYLNPRCYCHSGSVKESGSGRSLEGQPSGREMSSEGDNESGSSYSSKCAALEKLIKQDDTTLQNFAYDALEQHRSSLVRQMRKEFQHLERLNKMLLAKNRGDVCSSSSVHRAGTSGSKCEEPSAKNTIRSGHGSSSTATDSSTHSKTGHERPSSIQLVRSGRANSSAVSEDTHNRARLNLPVVRKKPVGYFLPYTASSKFKPQPPTRTKHLSASKPNAPGTRDKMKPRGFSKNSQSDSDESVTKRVTDGSTPSSERESSSGENNVKYHDTDGLTLQEAFHQHCPEILANVQHREQIVSTLKLEREARADIKRNYFRERQNCLSPNDSLNQALPPAVPRLMPWKEMKKLTVKTIQRLPEVKEKEVQRRLQEDKRTNRLLSQVFSRKLRERALKGDVNILHSRPLIKH